MFRVRSRDRFRAILRPLSIWGYGMTTTTEQAIAHLRRCAAVKDRPARQVRTDGYAYFIGPEGGAIKIGFSTDPDERLYRLQTSHPERLHLWAEATGGKKQERAYHAQFADAWIAGEWFTRTPEIEAEIARLQEAV